MPSDAANAVYNKLPEAQQQNLVQIPLVKKLQKKNQGKAG
jgi:hypothetical protein